MTTTPSADAAAYRRLPGPWDVAAAVVAVVLALVVLRSAGSGSGYHPPDARGQVLTAVGAAALAWARTQPLVTVLGSSIAAAALAIADYHVDVLPFVVSLGLFACGSYLEARRALVGLGGAVALLAVTVATRPIDLGLRGAIQSCGIFVVVWLLGRFTRGRRQTLLALVDAAEQRSAADRDRAALAQVEERLRIARELHDVLAHSISVISVQATVGEHLSATDPGAARRSLTTIGDVSRSSMDELRQMLNLLRDDTATGTTSPSYEPPRGFGDLDELLGTYRSSGLDVRRTSSGDPRPVSASAELCAYRIVQEALTNTLKHAGARSASVHLAYGPESWSITIRDDGSGPPSTPPTTDHPGHGLAGMRERTALLGGHIVTGAQPTGGFAVRATIPYTDR